MTLEASSSINHLTLDPPAVLRPHPGGRVHYLKWGIFDIAYEVPSTSPFRLPRIDTLFKYRRACRSLMRFLAETFHVDPIGSLQYLLCVVWLILSPPLSLFLANCVLSEIEQTIRPPPVSSETAGRSQLTAFRWLACVFLSTYVENALLDHRIHLGGKLRSHFLPRLARASLEWDIDNLNDGSKYFPSPHEFGDHVPGWDFIEGLSTRIRNMTTLALEIMVMIYIIFSRDLSDAWISAVILLLFLLVVFLAPSNGVGGAGYTFWTKNEIYNRLMVLFNVVFDPQYRATLVKDGLTYDLSEQYRRTSDSLGVVKADTWILGWQLPPPTYWRVLESCVIDSPMALYAVLSMWDTRSSSLSTAIAMHYSISSLRNHIESTKTDFNSASIYDLMLKVERFYHVLDMPIRHSKGRKAQPTPQSLGTRITLRNVSYRYPTAGILAHNAVHKVDFEILPGQVVLVAGANGSGKSTLIKLMTGLLKPSRGHVLIDHVDLQSQAIPPLRERTAYITQSEAVYPLSLRENILMGLVNQEDRQSITDTQIDEAACLGGFLQTMNRLGRGTVLNPCGIISFSHLKVPGRGAIDALDRNCPTQREIPISTGERQRLIASRAMMRIKHGNPRLVILDEPTNALDAIAERSMFQNFRALTRENSQTLIIITHRLRDVATHADLILFMRDGAIAQSGTHDELLRFQGPYSELYNALADAD